MLRGYILCIAGHVTTAVGKNFQAETAGWSQGRTGKVGHDQVRNRCATWVHSSLTHSSVEPFCLRLELSHSKAAQLFSLYRQSLPRHTQSCQQVPCLSLLHMQT